MKDTIRLHGVLVPTLRFAQVKKLADSIFGRFDVATNERFASRESVKIALLLDTIIDERVAAAEKLKGARA